MKHFPKWVLALFVVVLPTMAAPGVGGCGDFGCVSTCGPAETVSDTGYLRPDRPSFRLASGDVSKSCHVRYRLTYDWSVVSGADCDSAAYPPPVTFTFWSFDGFFYVLASAERGGDGWVATADEAAGNLSGVTDPIRAAIEVDYDAGQLAELHARGLPEACSEVWVEAQMDYPQYANP